MWMRIPSHLSRSLPCMYTVREAASSALQRVLLSCFVNAEKSAVKIEVIEAKLRAKRAICFMRDLMRPRVLRVPFVALQQNALWCRQRQQRKRMCDVHFIEHAKRRAVLRLRVMRRNTVVMVRMKWQ